MVKFSNKIKNMNNQEISAQLLLLSIITAAFSLILNFVNVFNDEIHIKYYILEFIFEFCTLLFYFVSISLDHFRFKKRLIFLILYGFLCCVTFIQIILYYIYK